LEFSFQLFIEHFWQMKMDTIKSNFYAYFLGIEIAFGKEIFYLYEIDRLFYCIYREDIFLL